MTRFGQRGRSLGGGLARFIASGGALVLGVVLTIALFLVLPVLENIGRPEKRADLTLTTVDAVEPPPPPPTVEEQKPEPPPEEAPPPELTETAPPLDLSQLELALNPGLGEGLGGDFAVKLSVAGADGSSGMQSSDEIFALADLDQAPRVVFQPAPAYPPEMKKKKIQGTVYVMFIVDKNGRVKDPRIQKSDNPAFDAPALNAVKRWRFDPGKVGGEAVQFRMRVPITFAL
ncbi:MAG TPA: energy transducer TonB [Anaerolineae bacterium]|nr:energy transducer TonB [Anaerolineae bacterium]